MQETVVSKGKSDVGYNKTVNEEYRPRVPYPNATRKDRSDEQSGELTLRVGDETITLQAHNSGITLNIESNGPHQSTKTDNMTLQKLSFKKVHEPCSRNDRGQIHEERRLQIEELDEWRAHKLRNMVNQNYAKTSLIPLQREETGRVEAGHDFPKTRDAINPHGRAIWPWVNLIGEPRHARGKARFYFFNTGVRHARAVKSWTIIHGRGIFIRYL
ncbi:hypothetical protein GOBAR_AA05630 [Gossypium barbadense]|uniref:Uncharacterized protein n=1 Tax=Gossypium barbadense TaxID=3634 RepID=A0A2P5YH92_GOSBA|nr:hypothetical protein GOBAR_AA05630 [Gossypium barbadense]